MARSPPRRARRLDTDGQGWERAPVDQLGRRRARRLVPRLDRRPEPTRRRRVVPPEVYASPSPFDVVARQRRPRRAPDGGGQDATLGHGAGAAGTGGWAM